MSRRATLIDQWIAGRSDKDQAVARRAGQHLTGDDVAAALERVAVDDARPAGSRRREISAARVLARELAAAGELSGIELAAVLAVTAPPVTAAERRAPIDVEAAIEAAPIVWPDSPLRASCAATAVVLNVTAGVLLRQAVELRWDDVDLVTGTVAGGHRVPAGPLPQLTAHRRVLEEFGAAAYLFPVLSRGPGPASVSQPERPGSARTLSGLVATLRAATRATG